MISKVCGILSDQSGGKSQGASGLRENVGYGYGKLLEGRCCPDNLLTATELKLSQER